MLRASSQRSFQPSSASGSNNLPRADLSRKPTSAGSEALLDEAAACCQQPPFRPRRVVEEHIENEQTFSAQVRRAASSFSGRPRCSHQQTFKLQGNHIIEDQYDSSFLQNKFNKFSQSKSVLPNIATCMISTFLSANIFEICESCFGGGQRDSWKERCGAAYMDCWL